MTNVRAVHGYEYYCACGETGLTWKTAAEARAEGNWHNYHVHGDGNAALEREDSEATRGAESS